MKHWIIFLGMASTMAHADQISVLSGGAAKSFIEPLAASFKGHTVKLEFQPMGKLTKSLADGYPADMVVVTSRSAGAVAAMNPSWTFHVQNP